MDEPSHAPYPKQGHHDENQTKWHQDGGLQKIRDHDRPQSAQHTIEDDKRSRPDDRPSHRKTTSGRNKQAQAKQGTRARE